VVDLGDLKIPVAMRPAVEAIIALPALGPDGTAAWLGESGSVQPLPQTGSRVPADKS
jgi:hypothetical protein